MKNLYITLSFMLATTAVIAQNKDTKTADKHFDRFEYVEAAEEYLELVNDGKADGYVYQRLADSYYNVFNYKEAVKYYDKAVAAGVADSETHYRYAQMLKAAGRYEESNTQMRKFAQLVPSDKRAMLFMEDPNYLPKLRKQNKLFDEKLLEINSEEYGSFGPVLTDDNTLYFTSARNTARKTYEWNDQPYLDLYMATYNANGTFSEPVPVDGINSKWHDGPAAVTADGKVMYFSSESFKESKQFERDKDANAKIGQVYLYKATKQGDSWGNVQPLPFNDKRWSTGNPSISKDGKTLYFTSDREGSVGDTDIWMVEVKGGNSYGEPVNLGSNINTEGKETFPFITEDNHLYFSSNARPGFGGHDIYMVDLDEGGAPMNVGAPINSPQDDFSFSYNVGKKMGYFASNRSGVDKLYSATPICGVEAIVMVKDANTGKPLASAKVAILDEENNVIEGKMTGADGKVTYNIDCDRAYTVQAITKGYEGNSFPVAETDGGKVTINAELKPIEEIVVPPVIVLNPIFFEFDKSNITQQAAFELDKVVQLMQENEDMVVMVKAHTDNRGSDKYNMRLSNRRAKSSVQYIISKGIAKSRISGEGFGESQPKVDCGTDCSEEQHAENRRSEFIIVKK
ncbi:OmpA family protein [Flavobacterium litorale]|uniref:OmpA family protein n=1 Tax=Flavobacterium litorale TaxID=2856519 RepID=A0ABX8V804_9FLAO|nr:OmpA family protein [Flavobacterium litorale]QYJ68745.1 OmpA family protein [Flavobacterium litorale]QYJ68989.1 OmpA family protein [Flavobacterium litorale]